VLARAKTSITSKRVSVIVVPVFMPRAEQSAAVSGWQDRRGLILRIRQAKSSDA
jgi:hypothetical protein